MLKNPELQRNFWLDFSLHRTILAPVIISLLVYIAHLTNTSPARMSFYIALFFIFLWGIKTASETVIEEINNNTWDFQRQSSLSPTTLMLGKLFGSTLYAWYGASIAFFYYIIFNENIDATLFRNILVLIGGGLLGQALALLVSMQVVPQIRREHGQKTFRYFLLGLAFSALITSTTLSLQTRIDEVHWFQFQFAIDNFSFVSLWIFTLWALIGLQRSFNSELQYPQLPIGWLLFNLFLMFYLAGLSNIYFDFSKITNHIPSNEFLTLSDLELLLQKTPIYTTFLVAYSLVYIVIISETLNIVRYQKIFYRMHSGHVYEALQAIPLWVISFLLMVITGIVSICQLSGLSKEITQSFSPTIFITTIMLFVIRDLLLFHYFSFSTTIQRVVGAFVIYLILLYFLFPALLSALHFGDLNVIFLPSWGDHATLAFCAIFAQVGLLSYLCINSTKHYPSYTPR